MTDMADQLPDDLARAHAMILAERAARREAEAVAARAQAVNSHSDALIARLRMDIEKLKRDIHGSRSERKARLLEQMELQARGAGSRRQPGRTGGRDSGKVLYGPSLRAQAPFKEAVSGAPAARTRRHCPANKLPMLPRPMMALAS